MEAGAPGAPMDPAVHHVVEEQKSKLDPVTAHSQNMVVKPVQVQPQRMLAVTQIHVQSMEVGAPGAPMGPAMLHVVEEQKLELEHVTLHCHNMVVKAVQDQPHQVLSVTQIHVQSMEAGAPGAPMDHAVKHVGEANYLAGES